MTVGSKGAHDQKRRKIDLCLYYLGCEIDQGSQNNAKKNTTTAQTTKESCTEQQAVIDQKVYTL